MDGAGGWVSGRRGDRERKLIRLEKNNKSIQIYFKLVSYFQFQKETGTEKKNVRAA